MVKNFYFMLNIDLTIKINVCCTEKVTKFSSNTLGNLFFITDVTDEFYEHNCSVTIWTDP